MIEIDRREQKKEGLLSSIIIAMKLKFQKKIDGY